MKFFNLSYIWCICSSNTHTTQKRMDKVQCYLSGVLICSGYLSEYSDIICGDDDFELPGHMFQTSLNTIYPLCKDQLVQARRKIQGLTFRHPSQIPESSESDDSDDVPEYE